MSAMSKKESISEKGNNFIQKETETENEYLHEFREIKKLDEKHKYDEDDENIAAENDKPKSTAEKNDKSVKDAKTNKNSIPDYEFLFNEESEDEKGIRRCSYECFS